MSIKGKGRSIRPEHQIYAHALPLVPVPFTNILARSLNLVSIENPHCVGIFDAPSRSVWIINARDREILWRRGFFGKGNLSRSEPSWLKRRINQLAAQAAGRKVLTAEEITAQRREERKHFKAERERAIAEAAAQAEAVFRAEGKLPEAPTEHISTTVRASIAAQKKNQRAAATAAISPSSPSIPDIAVEATEILPSSAAEELPEVEDMEHLQLSLQEAFFLSWGLDCLSILDPTTDTYLSREELWRTFLRSSCTIPTSILDSLPLKDEKAEHLWKRFDNPFLVYYVAYHHFRSLGWVVKSGIKFCVDLLLYKKGPVFSHAEFSIVICPVYENPEEEELSPFDLPNTKPFTWSWLSTLNRSNTQVRKSLMIAYVTIPSNKRVSLSKIDSPEVFGEYTIREVTVKRFVPARMRD